MQVAMVVLFGDKSFYYNFAQSEHVLVSESREANLCIPGLGRELIVSDNDNAIVIDVIRGNSSTRISAYLDSPVIIDKDDKIALFFSNSSKSNKSVYLPMNCTVDIGMDEDLILDDGKTNDVIVNLPFVSHHHARIIRLFAVYVHRYWG